MSNGEETADELAPCIRCGEPKPANRICRCLEPLDPEDLEDDGTPIRFADPGGNSALRAAGPGNPRNLPCPTCKRPNKLTPRDRALGYQCDSCADAAERGEDVY